MYRNAKNGDVYACDKYIDLYPEGRHMEDVRYFKIQHTREDQFYNTNNIFTAINEYLHQFPNGKYAQEINATCDSIWDEKIRMYNERDKVNESPEAVKYMTEMLQYMKKNRINNIAVDVTSHLQLKDYEEYDSKVRSFLEATNTGSLPLAEGMISLKSNFSEADVSSLMEILSEGVQRSFDKRFTPGLITVKDISSNDVPTIHFDYTIQSQEHQTGAYAIPDIWTYSQNDIAINYLIRISIIFNALCSIPGSSTSFEYSEKVDPTENISNISDINDGYLKMTLMSFAEFSNKMAQNMGLKEIYCQVDE